MRIACSVAADSGIARYRKRCQLPREIVVENDRDADGLDIRFRIDSNRPVILPLTLRIDQARAVAGIAAQYAILLLSHQVCVFETLCPSGQHVGEL